MKPEVAQFVEEMLARIRREFFARLPEKIFYQERRMLIRAITWPAKWMNDRGVRLPPSDYRKILGLVITTIKQHGNQVKFRRFSLYFFKAVQEHMAHKGDQYYYRAKVRSVSAILPAVTRDVGRRGPVDQTTDTLSQINRVIRSPGGRRRRDSEKSGHQLQLASLSPLPTDKRRQLA